MFTCQSFRKFLLTTSPILSLKSGGKLGSCQTVNSEIRAKSVIPEKQSHGQTNWWVTMTTWCEWGGGKYLSGTAQMLGWEREWRDGVL